MPHPNIIWSGLLCWEIFNPYEGYECGACPYGYVGNGITCIKEEYASEDYGCGEKCDEIMIEEEIVVPCRFGKNNKGGRCTPDTCEEQNPCKKNELCIDDEGGTRCEKNPEFSRASRNRERFSEMRTVILEDYTDEKGKKFPENFRR